MLRIDALDVEDITRVAYQNMHDSELGVTALGPTHGLVHLTMLRRENIIMRV